MNPQSFLFSLTLLLQTLCGFAANPGVLYLPGSVPYDRDATNFIVRAGIPPRSAEAKAIGQLVHDLKQANLWTNLDALYPFVGRSSNSCAQNLVSTNWPITWSGGVTFSYLGVKGNGVDAWGNTGYLQSSRGALTNDFHIYAWAEMAPQTNAGPIIANAHPGAYGGLGVWHSGPQNYAAGYQLSDNGGALLLTTNGNSIVIQSGANSYIMGDTALFTSAIHPVNVCPTNSVRLLGNLPNSGIIANLQGYSLATVHAASFGRSMTPAQATNYFTIIKSYENTLHRINRVQLLTP